MLDPHVYSIIVCLKLAVLTNVVASFVGPILVYPSLPFVDIDNGTVCLLLFIIIIIIIKIIIIIEEE